MASDEKRKWRGQDFQDEWVFSRVSGRGVFVDIGAFDGESLSNTFILETLYDWTGWLIEGNQELAAQCKKKRPASRTFCALLGGKKEKRTFWLNQKDPFVSSLLKDKAGRFSDCREEERQVFHAGSFLESLAVPSLFHYLSIDVEGMDWEVLLAVFSRRFRPALVTIETDKWDGEKKDQREGLLRDIGYTVDQRTAHDWFLVNGESLSLLRGGVKK